MTDPRDTAFRWRSGDRAPVVGDHEDHRRRQWSMAQPPPWQLATPDDPPPPGWTPQGDITAAWRNQINQHQQVADAQRRRAARAEARLNQLRGDILWIALFVGPGCFCLGWFLAWLWTTWRR